MFPIFELLKEFQLNTVTEAIIKALLEVLTLQRMCEL
jgi:hypothetical protein